MQNENVYTHSRTFATFKIQVNGEKLEKIINKQKYRNAHIHVILLFLYRIRVFSPLSRMKFYGGNIRVDISNTLKFYFCDTHETCRYFYGAQNGRLLN